MYEFPSTEAVVDVVKQHVPSADNFIGHSILPMADPTRYANVTTTISWDLLGNVKGLTSNHVLGGDPKLIARRQMSEKSARPGYWAEAISLNERHFTQIRGLGPEHQKRAGYQLVVDSLEQLLCRLDCREEQLIWDCLSGTLTLADDGVIRTVDYGIPAANKVNTNSSSGYSGYWSAGGSDPVADIQKAIDLIDGVGAGKITAYMNRATAKLLVNNSAVLDRVKYTDAVLKFSTSKAGLILPDLVGDIDAFVVYNEGYTDDNGSRTTFIPDNTVYLIGAGENKGPGRLGEFASVPSVHNGGLYAPQAGRFVVIDDHTDEKIKPHLDIMTGIYGLPILFHPEYIAIMTVAS